MDGFKNFTSIIDLLEFFPTEETCEEYLAFHRWKNDDICCPYCNDRNVNKLGGKTKRYKCYSCKKQYSVKVGTIFHNSKIPLRKWFIAIHLLTTSTKGISSHQLARELKIHQESAWFMLHRIRETYIQSDKKLRKRTVEADETYLGGLESNKHKNKKTPNNQGRSTKTKAAVFGVMERNGNVYAIHVGDLRGSTIIPIIKSKVCKNATIYTDEYRPYRQLKHDFKHQYVNHSQGKYVIGEAHTNNLEGFWSQMKRAIGRAYYSVSKKHLQRYVNEAVFRHNNIIEERFNIVLSKSIGVRLDYEMLVGKVA